MSISQLKARMRGPLKIVWIIDWIETIPRLGLGVFDFVGCTGVLHHLKSPQNGIKVVNEAQTKQGGAEFMVYGTFGRTGIYQIQELLSIINAKGEIVKKELKIAKHMIQILPYGHWFRHLYTPDMDKMGDVGIYDLLLHKRDVSYTIAGLYEWIKKGGYNLAEHSIPENSIPLSIKVSVANKCMFNMLLRKDISVQESVSEIIMGNIVKQDSYLSKNDNSKASLSTEKNVVFANGSPKGFRYLLTDLNSRVVHRNDTFITAKFARSRGDENVENPYDYSQNRLFSTNSFLWPLTEFNSFVIIELTKKPNRAKSLKMLIDMYNTAFKSNVTITQGSILFNDLFSYLQGTGMFFIKNKYIKDFPLTHHGDLFTITSQYETTVFW